jgi:hypothetical protein
LSIFSYDRTFASFFFQLTLNPCAKAFCPQLCRKHIRFVTTQEMVWTAMHQAAQDGNAATVRKLISERKNVNEVTYRHSQFVFFSLLELTEKIYFGLKSQL